MILSSHEQFLTSTKQDGAVRCSRWYRERQRRKPVTAGEQAHMCDALMPTRFERSACVVPVSLRYWLSFVMPHYFAHSKHSCKRKCFGAQLVRGQTVWRFVGVWKILLCANFSLAECLLGANIVQQRRRTDEALPPPTTTRYDATLDVSEAWASLFAMSRWNAGDFAELRFQSRVSRNTTKI